MSTIHPEVFLMAGYAVLLLAAALVLDLLARHSQNRSEQYRTAGFDYNEQLDAWECPEGEYLWRSVTDHEQRFVRYRGKVHVCNSCPSKKDCTDSNEGREITRAMDPWPHSEAGRFHRGISLSLTALAGFITIVEMVRHHELYELMFLGALLFATILMGRHLLAALRASPANFPSPDAKPPKPRP